MTKKRKPMSVKQRVAKYRAELDALAQSFGWQNFQAFVRAAKLREVDLPRSGRAAPR